MGYYVTTPIYYVNAEPHLGHAYTTIAVDVLARHRRQRGDEVFFLTGTDEHGEPVAQVAEREGVSPRELADRNSVRFRDMAERVGATNDFFIRTSDERHAAAVQRVLQRVYDRGYVYEGVYEGWYCPRCADFKTDSELEDGNRCPIHRIELTREREDNYFFKLSEFQEPLERLFAERPDWVVPRIRYNEALSFVRQGLQDVSLTRAKLTWGVPVPWDEGHVFYVWFDALLNYYTALSFAREGEDLTDRFWPADVHVIGKDILKFHAVFWPALLMAAGIEVPRQLCIHGYLLMDEHKMSKSLGNVIDPFEVADIYGVDALRYYLFAAVSFGQDGNVSPADFETRYTAELANEYGNLAGRTLPLIERHRGGVVPDGEPPAELTELFDGAVDRVRARFDAVEVSGALEETWRLVRALNRFVQAEAPWKLAKDESQSDRLDSVLYGLAEGLRVVSVLLHPFMPDATGKLLDALGQDDLSLDLARFGAVPAGARVSGLAPLFPRIEQPERAADPAT
ncbi:MAG TPA: methionine--tRNA ligase [Thermoleophilaceae bacterium]